MIFSKPNQIPDAYSSLPGRDQAMAVSGTHLLLQKPYVPPFPEGMTSVQFGMGCFWGAERRFWQQPEVYVTAAGYAGGATPNPIYEEVCSGKTGHTEVVLVVFPDRPDILIKLLALFWESHDPTQGMQQGNDRGTQYRSAIYVGDADKLVQVEASRDHYQTRLNEFGLGKITTELKVENKFYYAEDVHQQYLIRVPHGYCGLAGTGVCY